MRPKITDIRKSVYNNTANVVHIYGIHGTDPDTPEELLVTITLREQFFGGVLPTEVYTFKSGIEFEVSFYANTSKIPAVKFLRDYFDCELSVAHKIYLSFERKYRVMHHDGVKKTYYRDTNEEVFPSY